jgi:hypothetical protein
MQKATIELQSFGLKLRSWAIQNFLDHADDFDFGHVQVARYN